MKWKRDNQEREEAKRKEIDKEEEIIKAKFRADTIQRAKDLQYEEKEKVKFLRSQQLYTDVVETRKKQIEEKMEREKHAAEEERRWHEHTVKMVQEAERKNKEKALLQKKRALENAEAMNRQRIEAEKCRKKILAAQRKAEEATINQAQAEISNMQEKLRKQKTNMKRKCKEEMEMLFKDIEIKNEQMQEKEMRDEKKRQDDIARMAFLATARANLEIKHFEERQATRKILSDRAAEDLKARSSREVEIFIREQKAQESKEKAKKEEEIRLKKEMEKEIHQSRKEQIKMRQERREREIAEEKVLTEQYKQMTLQDLQREKKKDSELRRRHNDIRAFQLQQIEEKQKIRIKEKESRLEEAKKVRLKIFFIYFMYLQYKCFIDIIFPFRWHSSLWTKIMRLKSLQ